MVQRHIRHSVARADIDSLTAYLREIRSYPPLSIEDECALAERFRAGDRAALDRLVCANLRFVVSVAKRYQNQGVPLSDLINEGNLGLMRAATRFDTAKHVRFISYAVWWIRQAIVRSLASNGHTVRVPISRAGALYRITRRANALRQELGRDPTLNELARGLDMSEADVEGTLPIAQPYVSLDVPLGDSDDSTLLDYLPDSGASIPDDDGLAENLAESMAAALGRLREREALVLRMYFGFDGNEPMTLESIGARLDVTRERVRQIKEKAISRLRRSEQARRLATFRD